MNPERTIVTFNVEWGGSADLSVEEVWPDGDAPKNPTSDDVVQAMLKSGSVWQLYRDWDLDIQEVEVYGPGGRRSITDRTFREAKEVDGV
jgi:hypothetical protein